MGTPCRAGGKDRRRPGTHHDLREARDRVGNELAVLVGGQQRHVEHVGIVERDAEHQGLRLDLGPVGQALIGTVEQLAGGDGLPPLSSYSRRNTWCEACEV